LPSDLHTMSGYAITAETEQPEAAWAWLTFLTRQVSVIQSWPARKSLGNVAVFPLAPLTVHDDLRQAYRTSLTQYQDAEALLWGTSPHSDIAQRLYAYAVRNAWETGETPQVLLAQAQTTFETYLACVKEDHSTARVEACSKQVGVPDQLSIYGISLP